MGPLGPLSARPQQPPATGHGQPAYQSSHPTVSSPGPRIAEGRKRCKQAVAEWSQPAMFRPVYCAPRRPRRERYGRAARAERSRRALFEEPEVRFRGLPRRTRLKNALNRHTSSAFRPNMGSAWRVAHPANPPKSHHAGATRTPTPSHAPSPRGVARPHHGGGRERGAVARRAQQDHGDAPSAPILRRPVKPSEVPSSSAKSPRPDSLGAGGTPNSACARRGEG